jgi:hypothetical protein
MVHIPAICDNCGNVFPSGLSFEFARNITLSGNKSKCGACGSWARIPDGVYNFYDNVIEILQAPERTIHDLQKLAGIILKGTTQGQVTSEEIEKEIKEEVPAFSSLAKFLPKNAMELVAYLQILVSIIIPLITNADNEKTKQDQKIEIHQQIEVNQHIEIHQHFENKEVRQETAATKKSDVQLPNKKDRKK